MVSMNASTDDRRNLTLLPIFRLGIVGWRRPLECWRIQAELMLSIRATSETVIKRSWLGVGKGITVDGVAVESNMCGTPVSRDGHYSQPSTGIPMHRDKAPEARYHKCDQRHRYWRVVSNRRLSATIISHNSRSVNFLGNPETGNARKGGLIANIRSPFPLYTNRFK
jgi:hypothetical protein